MTDFCISLAGIPMMIHSLFPTTQDFCRDYITAEPPLFDVSVSEEDISEVRTQSVLQARIEGRGTTHATDSYLETLALYRRILDHLLNYDVLLFHGSVVAVHGKSYMFTAKSGTGKTTHTRLWLKNIPDCHVLNGDKPLVKFTPEGIFACGTPWQGKENYGTNEILPLSAICILERDLTNHIEPIPFRDALSTLLVQSHHPAGGDNLLRTVELIQQLSGIGMYRLGCNMEDEAAIVSYRGMTSPPSRSML